MIGIISSSTENYNLIKLCQRFGVDYMIFADTEFWPYQDKEDETLKERYEVLEGKAQEAGCTHLLTSPRLEVLLKDTQTTLPILPLFQSYLTYAYQASLIGKIGYFGGYYDIKLINTVHSDLAKNYVLTEKQQSTKNFIAPFAKRTKETSMWIFFLRIFSNRDMMINRIIKFDLRYFKDANVDTIIPLSRSYFNYQKTITNFFNIKKQKFHKRQIVIELFEKITKNKKEGKTQEKVSIYYTGSLHLISSKKREHIASYGGETVLEYRKI